MKKHYEKSCMGDGGRTDVYKCVGKQYCVTGSTKDEKIVMNKKKVTLKVGKTFKLKVKKG